MQGDPDRDLDLLQHWRDGDKAAGNELFERHFPAMRRFFRNKLAADEVEDIIQRTFLACVESRDRFRGDSTFRTYLFTVARHELYRHLRKRSKDVVAAGLDFSVSSLDALGMSPSTAMAKNEEHEMVLTALQHLPVQQQVLLELYYWERVPGPELARIMEVAEPTIRTRLHRARNRLRETLEELRRQPTTLDQLDTWARSAF